MTAAELEEFSLRKVLREKKIPREISSLLVVVRVRYIGFDSLSHDGLLIVHRDLAGEIRDIFIDLYKSGFPLRSVSPVSFFKWSDSLSASLNNTSCFNYRKIKGYNKFSYHALGRAVDINPLFNPQFRKGKVFPPNGKYIKERPGTVYEGGGVVEIFARRGWKWGGRWIHSKDFQHFYKTFENGEKE
ncbi:MAG: M15 family metallopeptidase [Fibrobacterota bacterium]